MCLGRPLKADCWWASKGFGYFFTSFFFFFFALRVLSQKALLTLSKLTAKLTSSSFTHTFLGQGQICFWET